MIYLTFAKNKANRYKYANCMLWLHTGNLSVTELILFADVLVFFCIFVIVRVCVCARVCLCLFVCFCYCVGWLMLVVGDGVTSVRSTLCSL